MIKQTSGAISFLLSAYRAILHKNFILGLALALAGTSAFSVANAVVEVTGTSNFAGDQKSYKINGYSFGGTPVTNFEGLPLFNYVTTDETNNLLESRNDPDFSITSSGSVNATKNAYVMTSYGKNAGTISVKEGSALQGSVVNNSGKITVGDYSYFHDDIVNSGTVNIGTSDDTTTYLVNSSTFINNSGTFTLDHVYQLGANPNVKYSISRVDSITDYVAYDIEASDKAGAKNLTDIMHYDKNGISFVDDPDEGSTVLIAVKGGTFNIKNSYLQDAESIADGYWQSEEYQNAKTNYGMDQDFCVQIDKVKEYMAAHGGSYDGFRVMNELYVGGGTMNIEKSTVNFNYVTLDGGTLNVTDSKLFTYDGGQIDINAGKVNIIAQTSDSIVGYTTESSKNREGTVVNVASGAEVTFSGTDNDHRAILQAKELNNNGTFTFKNEYYVINAPTSSGFDLNNNKDLKIEKADSESLAQVNLNNTAADAKVTVSTGTANAIKVNSINAKAGTITADSSNITTSKITVADGATATFGTVTSTGSVALEEGSTSSFKTFNVGTKNNRSSVSGSETTVSDNMIVTGGSSVSLDTLTSNGTVYVGTETSGSANVGIDTLVSGDIVVDPSWGSATAIAQVNAFGTDADNKSTTVGDISVGQNSAFGFGTKGTSALTGFLSAIGGLSENGITALAYLNDAITIGNGKGMAVDGTYETEKVITGTSEKVSAPNAKANTLILGKQSVLVLGNSVVKNAEITEYDEDGNAKDDSGTAAVTFASGSGSVEYTTSSKVMFDSSSIKTGASYRIFGSNTTLTNTTGGDDGNTSVVYKDATETAEATTDALQVSSRNGSFTAYVKEDGTTSAVESHYSASTMSNMSAPVYATADAAATDNSTGAGVSFLTSVLGDSQNAGLEAEQAARLAQFGGVYQNALMTSKVMDEAVNSRLGVGNVKSAFIYDDNAQDYGVWMTPVYKTQSSSSYDSDGLGYGAKVQLDGVTIGADNTFADKRVRVGVVFTVGEADVSGRGHAEGVDNASSFYGAGIYGGYYNEAFSLSANLGVTHVKNSVKTDTTLENYGTLSADVDADVFHIGATCQYEFATQYVNVTPHAGVYFANVDVAGYDVTSAAGVIATTDNETLTVLSFPVGVTLSHEFRASENVRLKPAADLRVTFNAGDTDIAYTTLFTGASAATNLKADVMDDVTYGIDLGLAASYKETFSFGLGVNYTGSSHADEIGATAHARYAF